MEFKVRASCSHEPLPSPKRTGGESGRDARTEPQSPDPPRRASPEKTASRTQKRPLAVSERITVKSTEQKKKKTTTTKKKKKTTTTKKKTPAAPCRKKWRPDAAAPFPPREPQIQLSLLKAGKQKEKKKSRDFCPFVRMERRTCVAVNHVEDKASRSGGAATARSLSGSVPNTSCFQLGRLDSKRRGRGSAPPRCCLCGHTANAMDLSDLYGPYYPATTPGSVTGAVQAEEESGRSVSLPSGSPLGLDECWIHEDCCVWSADVFLVRGKVYGLQEAARQARHTVCSACHQMGAIMGCLQKGCTRNYHYACAVGSGCSMAEENFSMRCPEHKNKLLAATNRRQRGRVGAVAGSSRELPV